MFQRIETKDRFRERCSDVARRGLRQPTHGQDMSMMMLLESRGTFSSVGMVRSLGQGCEEHKGCDGDDRFSGKKKIDCLVTVTLWDWRDVFVNSGGVGCFVGTLDCIQPCQIGWDTLGNSQQLKQPRI